MDSDDDFSGWLEVGGTCLPSPPGKTKLTVVDVSPNRWTVTYPTNPVGLRWLLSFVLLLIGFLPLTIFAIVLGARLQWLPFIPLYFAICFFLPLGIADFIAGYFRRAMGGVIRLEAGKVHYERGAILRVREDLELEPSSRFDVEDIGREENVHWALRLTTLKRKNVLATMNDLSRPELQWLCRRLNEFLGREFPSHCLKCGRPLEAQDVDCPRRSIHCIDCGFEGPSPDPFILDAVPAPPVASCPSCLEPIWLSNVHRETGGCRCRFCGWFSEREPPTLLEELSDVRNWFQDLIEYKLGKICDRSQGILTEPQLGQAVPTDSAAWSQLQAEALAVEENLRIETVEYRFRRMAYFWWVIFGLGLLTWWVCWNLYFHYQLPIPNRHFAYYVDRIVMQFFLLVCLASLGGLIWWSWQTARLQFTNYALQWSIGRKRRLIVWHTATRVAVPSCSWPPMFILKHGGAGLLLITPTAQSARALTRLCQSRVDAVSRRYCDTTCRGQP